MYFIFFVFFIFRIVNLTFGKTVDYLKDRDSTFSTTVKALIDSGTCVNVTTNYSICGNDSRAYSYYETFIYNSYRVVIISGVPEHEAEDDQTNPNPHIRCVRYQYFAAPASPVKSSKVSKTTMGQIAFFTSGTVLFNPLSDTDGTLATYDQWPTLDSCFGHSDKDKQYHYHAVSGACLAGATTASPKTLLGYATDGYPVYGYATDSSGNTLKSCWTTTLSNPSNSANFTYDTSGYSAGTCHLDKANGYTFSDGTYGYVMISDKFYVPLYRSVSVVASVCGFTP